MEPPKSAVDPIKITGPYPLLALLLTVIEGLLGFWLFKAEGSIERSVAGVLMTGILLTVIVAVIRIVERPKLRVRGLPKAITAAQTEATLEEIKSPTAEAIAAPDGSYLINRPPPDWIVEDLSWAEWAGRNLGIKAEAQNEEITSAAEPDNLIRVFRSPRVTNVTPLPGRTKLDGVRYPTALKVPAQTMLSIFRINRAQPPLYNERSLSHNFFREVNALTAFGLLTLRTLSSGTISGSGRKYQKAEFSQRIEDAIIGGKEGQSVDLNITLLGIESDLWDHILMMHYPSGLSGQPGVNADLDALLAIVNSFQPLKIVNLEQKRAALKQEAETKMKEFIAEKSEDMFYTEIGVTLLRLDELNLYNSKDRLRAMEMLKPFEIFAQEIGLKEQELESLFLSLHKAEAGDATEFIERIHEAKKAAEAKDAETMPASANLSVPDGSPPTLP